MNEKNEHIIKFEQGIHDIYKAYRFSHFGLYHLRGFYKENKELHGIKYLRIQDEDLGIDIRFTEKDVEQARDDGYYQRIMAGNTISMMYNIWEDNYRSKIAHSLGFKKKNDLKSDVFGDLGKIRNSITHNKYNRTSEIDKLKVFGYLFREDSFILDCYTVTQIVEKVLVELNKMKQN